MKFLEVKKEEVLRFLKVTYKERNILVVKIHPTNILWTDDGKEFKLIQGTGLEFKVWKTTETVMSLTTCVRFLPFLAYGRL